MAVPRFQLVFLSITVLMSIIHVLNAARKGSQNPNMVLSHLFAQAPAPSNDVAHPPPGKNTCPVPLDKCGAACDQRCSATSHKSACLMYCNYCCQGCLCVPPGTFGQKECCDCYNNWKTKEGKPKCP